MNREELDRPFWYFPRRFFPSKWRVKSSRWTSKSWTTWWVEITSFDRANSHQPPPLTCRVSFEWTCFFDGMAVCLTSSCTCFPYKFESGGHYTIKKNLLLYKKLMVLFLSKSRLLEIIFFSRFLPSQPKNDVSVMSWGFSASRAHIF